MQRFKKHLRLVVALVCLTGAFLLSISFGDRGLQFDLRQSSGAASDVSANKDYNLSALRILNRVLLHLKDSYVEPERINPSKMLVEALDEIQNSIAEVVVNYDRKEENPKKVTVRVNERSRTFTVEGIESLWEMSFKLKEIFGFIQESLGPDTEVKYQEVEYAAINGMLKTLDPHSTLLPPRNYEEMQTQTGGKFGGLGIVISVRDGQLTVISPIDGTPAAKAGVKARDKIMRIADESTVNMSLNEAVNMLRGDPGTTIDLYLMREGWDEPRKFTVERAIIKIESVESQALKNKTGYVRIKNFQANTFSDTKRHLNELKEKMGGMNGLILDLRQNPGGLLEQSIRISDLFLQEGTIVSTVGQGNKLREKKLATTAGTEPLYPIVVLVDPGSASASEIVSGALKNNDRAIVVGDTTFGKGSVQVLYEFPDSSALKLTVAQYLTPGEISIQGRGIVPDLRTLPAAIRDKRVDLFSEASYREGDLETALTNDNVSKDKKPDVVGIKYLAPTEAKPDDFEDPDAFKEDFQIKLAQRLLKAAGKTWQRPQMLKSITGELAKVQAAEMTSIQRELKKLGVDWSEGPSPRAPKYTMEVTTSVPDATVAAGETITLTATFTNTGDAPFYRAKALSTSDNGILDAREFIFGKVDPGASRTWSVDIKVPQDMPTRHDVVTMAISDAKMAFGDQGVPVKITGQTRPHFAFSYEIEDPSNDGVFQPGEEIKLKVHVENTGERDSAETLVYLKNFSRDAIYLKRGRTKIEKIPAKGHAETEFTFEVKKAPEGGAVELEVDVYDATFREFTQKKFKVPFNTSAGVVRDAKGEAKAKAKASLYASAHPDATEVARVAAGATLPVLARTEEWIKVDLGKRTAWIAANDVTLDEGAKTKLTGLDALRYFEAPSVVLTTPEAITKNRTIQLTAKLHDDSAIKDYYIFIYNRDRTKLNTLKLDYTRVGKGDTTIEKTIPLFDGMNRIAVYVRDAEGMTATESAYVFRTK